MTRRQAVAFFLGDTAFLADPKFRALQRRIPDPDDFNSAVGAWFVALAAARRNGHPELDVATETASRFVPDLIAVGLIQETGFRQPAFDAWGAMSPQQASAGRARAALAQRDDAGHFLPAEPSEPSALDSPTSGVQPSPPLPSSQINVSSSEGGPGGNQPDDPAVAFQERTGEFPGTKMLSWIDDLGQTHGEARLAAMIRSTAMTGRNSGEYLRAVRDKLRAEDHAAEQAERADEKRRLTEKRKPLPEEPWRAEQRRIIEAGYAEEKK